MGYKATDNFTLSGGLGSPRIKTNLAMNQRKILLTSDVDSDSILECMYYLYTLQEIDRKTKTKAPIDILVNTNGGEVYEGLSLISLIERMKTDGYEINTINIGKAFSMGFMISICGTHKYAYKYSTYMLHDISTGVVDKAQNIMEYMEEINRLRDIFMDIVTSYTNVNEKDFKFIINNKLDKYYSSKESVQFGICDKII